MMLSLYVLDEWQGKGGLYSVISAKRMRSQRMPLLQQLAVLTRHETVMRRNIFAESDLMSPHKI